MQLNADFHERIVVHSEELAWVASPVVGVERRMLDRIGGEVARATTLVRYAPGSQFSPHVHGGGEELFVLEGVFQDEHGSFPRGSYLRNPPGSSHTPGSEPGCVLFVKLWQFDRADRTAVALDSGKMEPIHPASRPSVAVVPLFCDARETVRLERWGAHERVEQSLPQGGEFLVLEGEFSESGDRLRRYSWLRIPCGGRLCATAGPQGARVWLKTRHLRFVAAPGE